MEIVGCFVGLHANGGVSGAIDGGEELIEIKVRKNFIVKANQPLLYSAMIQYFILFSVCVMKHIVLQLLRTEQKGQRQLASLP